jgi:hypothetical protein
VSATCPAGHVSATSDYCDQCGAKIEGAPAAAPADPPAPVPAAPAAGSGAGVGVGVGETTAPFATIPPADAVLCPVCTTPRSGDDRFCEGCGYDFDAPPPPDPPPPGTVQWEAVATADRDYFDRVAPTGVTFPPHCPSRTFALSAAETRVGRHSGTRGISPEIDLTGAPEDTAISHLHALLLRQGDGSYSLVDPGSTNGTTLNDDPAPVATNVAIPLADGDRIHLGAWTTLTIHARS